MIDNTSSHEQKVLKAQICKCDSFSVNSASSPQKCIHCGIWHLSGQTISPISSVQDYITKINGCKVIFNLKQLFMFSTNNCPEWEWKPQHIGETVVDSEGTALIGRPTAYLLFLTNYINIRNIFSIVLLRVGTSCISKNKPVSW